MCQLGDIQLHQRPTVFAALILQNFAPAILICASLLLRPFRTAEVDRLQRWKDPRVRALPCSASWSAPLAWCWASAAALQLFATTRAHGSVNIDVGSDLITTVMHFKYKHTGKKTPTGPPLCTCVCVFLGVKMKITFLFRRCLISLLSSCSVWSFLSVGTEKEKIQSVWHN